MSDPPSTPDDAPSGLPPDEPEEAPLGVPEAGRRARTSLIAGPTRCPAFPARASRRRPAEPSRRAGRSAAVVDRPSERRSLARMLEVLVGILLPPAVFGVFALLAVWLGAEWRPWFDERPVHDDRPNWWPIVRGVPRDRDEELLRRRAGPTTAHRRRGGARAAPAARSGAPPPPPARRPAPRACDLRASTSGS